jgi:hypothetical protein
MSTPSYHQVRRHVERRHRQVSFFIFHLVVAMTATLIWMTGTESGVGTRVFAVLWFGVLVCHGMKVYLDGVRDRAVERSWRRYSGEAYAYADEPYSASTMTLKEMLAEIDKNEKPKRSMFLDDDETKEVESDQPEIDYNQLPLWTRR